MNKPFGNPCDNCGVVSNPRHITMAGMLCNQCNEFHIYYKRLPVSPMMESQRISEKAAILSELECLRHRAPRIGEITSIIDKYREE